MSPPGPRSTADFDRLYRESYQRVFRSMVAVTGSPAEAEDCTQEAFTKAFSAWGSWRGEVPAEAWVHRIAINTAISARRRQRLREVGELVRRLGRPVEPDPTAPELSMDLLREIQRLPVKQAAVLVLRHLHGYSNRELGVALGVSESTVASRLAAATATLRERLGRDRD
ncbi:MAG: polymerase sigma-70 factor, subfamily [Chloroflexota bacterium]|nr:polymerase sigma-70 factor, subfamily [Chloroflexota bacterium]